MNILLPQITALTTYSLILYKQQISSLEAGSYWLGRSWKATNLSDEAENQDTQDKLRTTYIH